MTSGEHYTLALSLLSTAHSAVAAEIIFTVGYPDVNSPPHLLAFDPVTGQRSVIGPASPVTINELSTRPGDPDGLYASAGRGGPDPAQIVRFDRFTGQTSLTTLTDPSYEEEGSVIKVARGWEAAGLAIDPVHPDVAFVVGLGFVQQFIYRVNLDTGKPIGLATMLSEPIRTIAFNSDGTTLFALRATLNPRFLGTLDLMTGGFTEIVGSSPGPAMFTAGLEFDPNKGDLIANLEPALPDAAPQMVRVDPTTGAITGLVWDMINPDRANATGQGIAIVSTAEPPMAALVLASIALVSCASARRSGLFSRVALAVE